jgi:hypothetical protein
MSHPQLLNIAVGGGAAGGGTHQRSHSHIPAASGRVPFSSWPSSGALPSPRRTTADQVAASYGVTIQGAGSVGGRVLHHSTLSGAGAGSTQLGGGTDGLPSRAAWEALLLGSSHVQDQHSTAGGHPYLGGMISRSGQLLTSTEGQMGVVSTASLALNPSGSLPHTPLAGAASGGGGEGGGSGYGGGYTCPLAWLDLSAGDKVSHSCWGGSRLLGITTH